MARIFPFRALRYDPVKVDLGRVVTQPYDKITPEMQRRYYDASPYNLVRIILGLAEPGDDGTRNVYTRAAEQFRLLRERQVLLQDPRPAIYRYDQRFVLPQQKTVAERHGFIALGAVEDYGQSVFRHEQTLAKPKSDRLELLRATRGHFGQIFMLYDDPERKVMSHLPCERVPDVEVRDDYGVFNRLWRVDDPETVAAVQSAMADQRLIIADGHHRYETALNYRNEMRAQGKGDSPDAPHQRVMMTFVNLAAPGLVILPTHRVVHGLDVSAADMLKSAAAHFYTQRMAGGTVNEILAELEDSGRRAPSFIAVTTDGLYLLRANLDALPAALAHVPDRRRQLDVTVLHELILRRALGLSQAAIDEQKNLTYVRDAWDAMARVRPAAGDARTADFAFLLNPVRIEQVRDIAFAGEVLPQKSTDFYPKLLSGLTIYALD